MIFTRCFLTNVTAQASLVTRLRAQVASALRSLTCPVSAG